MTKHQSIPRTSTISTGTVTVSCESLRALLGSVQVFATQDDSRPTLNGVWVMPRVGRLHVAAFNPYCAAFDSTETTDVTNEDFDALLPLGVVKTLIRDLKSLKKELRAIAKVTLDFRENGGAVTYPQEGRRKVQQHWTLEGPFPPVLPDYTKILPKNAEATSHISLNLNFIEMCLSSGRYMGNFTFHGRLAPVEISSDTFYAVIMPLRVPDPA